jgi:hemoglobin/transferrin/lactoferrin receptor protein
MKKNLLLWLLLGCAIFGHAQTITIRDQGTNAPLEFVTLINDNQKNIITTNSEGQADVTALQGSEKIQIRLLGYQTMTKSYSELEASGFAIALESSNLTLDEVVISATRWKQVSGNVPSKIISISANEVSLMNPQTAADLLGISGKVFIQKSQQGGGSPMIRGFATNRLVYSVDGVRMNTAIFRGGNIQNVINLDPFAVENTEVLFGSGSVIYGSDAIGGVMSFQTLTPQLSLGDKPLISGKTVSRYSSANKEKTAHFDVNVGWKKWALVTSFSSWDYDHLRQGSRGPKDYIKPYYVQRQDGVDVVITQDDPLLQIPSAYSQINLMQKVRFKPNEKWDIQYGFHFSETSPYGRYDRHNRVRFGTARYAEWNYGRQLWSMHNLSLTNTTSGPLYDQMTIRLAHQSFEESRIDRSLNNNNRNTQTENVKATSANIDFSKKVSGRQTLYYGVEYVTNDVKSRGVLTDISDNSTQAGPSRYPQSTWSSLAAYVNDEFRINAKTTVQAGLRYNQYKLDGDFTSNLDFFPFPFTKVEINSSALTGTLGGVYRPSESLVLSVNFSTAFRSPNVDDAGKIFDSAPKTVTIPNTNLEAEYAYNFDLGIAKVFGDAVKLDLTGYYTILNNALVRRDFQLNGQDSIVYDGEMSKVMAIQNAAVAKVYGIQAGLEIKLPAGFGLSTDLNYQVGEEELDDGTTSTLRHAPPFFGMTQLSYRAGKLNWQLYTQYQGERKFDDLPQEEQAKDEIYAKDDDGNNYSPSWYTLNIKAQYHLTEKFSVGAGIENLTDQRYRPYSSGISGAGRNFVISFKATF